MMQTFKFTLRTPEKDLFEGKAQSVTVALESGEMQIYAGHASITGSIGFSSLKIVCEGKDETFFARNGIISFDNGNNSGSILTLHCEKKSEMSLQTAKDYLSFIDEKLSSGEDLSAFQIHHLEGEKIAIEEQIKQVQS